jgi:hypothetical protein
MRQEDGLHARDGVSIALAHWSGRVDMLWPNFGIFVSGANSGVPRYEITMHQTFLNF